MRTVLLVISAAAGLGFAAPAATEDLIQIYDMAVQSDPVLKEAEQNLYSTREVKPQARALLLPSFDVTADAFPQVCDRIRASGAPIWKDNRSEGESLYFLDPDGHKLELHVGSLETRLAAMAAREAG